MRTISAPFVEAMMGGATDEIVVVLISIQHPDYDNQNIYLSSDNADLLDAEQQLRGTISRGQAFSFLPMSLSLPEEGEDASQVIQITIDGISQLAIPLLRSTSKPAGVTVEIVLASAPDQVEIEYPFFQMTSADVDAGRVVLSLSIDAMAGEPYPADNFTPSTFGGLWTTT